MSATAGAIYGFLHRIPVFHVEAGLRTRDLYSPWPEEFNRRVISLAAKIHFAPTQDAARELLGEMIAPEDIQDVGNTVIDSLMMVCSRLKRDKALVQKIDAEFKFLNPDKHLVLATIHRREVFGPQIRGIFGALKEIAADPRVQVVLSLHRNPLVREAATEILSDSKVIAIDPVDYVSFVYLMQKSSLIFSDSGGIQEEAPSLGKRVIVLRETTERPEGVAAGCNLLAGTEPENIIKLFQSEMDRIIAGQPLTAANPYGDGTSSVKIINAIRNFYS
jgi:UDP-N-acetylglucosamine 2-epimerase (non-hydrolysing)